ncbi:MAG: hypothetical protein AAF804_19885, partial [Bacteroidota bacterium]
KLDSTLHEAKLEYDKIQHEGKGKVEEWEQAFKHRAEHFRTKLDSLRVQAHLGSTEAKEEYEEARNEINQKVQEAKKFWQERSEKGEEKWEEFTGEMEEAYSHVKNAIKKFFA